MPQVNWALMVSTMVIVIGFGSSSALAAAYGIAVTLTMVITAILLHVVAIERWGWPRPLVFAVTGIFLTIDLAFFGANALKITHGGWLPLVIGAVLFTMMTTWKTGRRIVAERLTARAIPIEDLPRERRTAGARAGAGHGGVHDRAAAAARRPHWRTTCAQQGAARTSADAARDDRCPCRTSTTPNAWSMRPLGQGVFDVTMRYGFMEDLDVPRDLQRHAPARHGRQRPTPPTSSVAKP